MRAQPLLARRAGAEAADRFCSVQEVPWVRDAAVYVVDRRVEACGEALLPGRAMQDEANHASGLRTHLTRGV